MHSLKKTARRVLNDAQRGQFVNQGFVKFESAFSPPLGMDLVLPVDEHVLRRDVANGTVQADIVVMFPPAAAHPPATVAFPAGCTLLLAIWANVRFFRSIGDSNAKF